MKEFQGIENGAYQATKRGIARALAESGSEAISAPPVARRSKTTASAPRAAAEKKSPAVKAKPAKVAKPAGSTKAKGEKRSPEDLAALADKLAAEIKGTPGQNIEQIAKAMGETTKGLSLPIKKLLQTFKIRSTGQKRATRYFPK